MNYSPLDNKILIKSLESFFKKERGFVHKIPQKGDPVILLVSGGLDSMLLWGMLLLKYKFNVYPLFFNKGENRKNRESQSVHFFSNYYSKQVPKLFHKPVYHTIYLPQKEIIKKLRTPYFNLSEMSYEGNAPKKSTTNIFLGSPGLSPFYGMFYARFLELTEKKKIRTIYSAIMLGDGDICASQNMSAILSINASMCSFTNEYDWQYTSPFIDKKYNLYFSKKELIKWGAKKNFPFEKTWSCYKSLKFQCGECLACYARKDAFKEANVVDRTKYMSYEFRNTFKLIKLKIKNFIINFL